MARCGWCCTAEQAESTHALACDICSTPCSSITRSPACVYCTLPNPKTTCAKDVRIRSSQGLDAVRVSCRHGHFLVDRLTRCRISKVHQRGVSFAMENHKYLLRPALCKNGNHTYRVLPSSVHVPHVQLKPGAQTDRKQHATGLKNRH
eukprot:3890458-Pleurochrysis_carterae.AAC.1